MYRLSLTTADSKLVGCSSDLFPKLASRGCPNFPLKIKNTLICIPLGTARNAGGAGGGESSPIAYSVKTYPHHSGCCFYNQRNWTDYYYRWQVRNYVFSFLCQSHGDESWNDCCIS